MDLSSAVVTLNQAEVWTRLQYAVARKVLDNQDLQGSAAIKLIEAAGRTASRAGDELAVAATGLGGELDVYA